MDEINVEMNDWRDRLQGIAKLSNQLRRPITVPYAVRDGKKASKNTAKIEKSTTWHIKQIDQPEV
jgi:hypothetical protein